MKRFSVFAHQSEFIRTRDKFPALVAGYGAGKTYAFCLKALVELGRNPSKICLLAEPTFPMVRDVLKPTLEEVIRDAGFQYEYSATEMKYVIKWDGGYGTIYMRSAENWIRWAGLNLACGGIDEAALLRDDKAWKMLLSRLRDGSHLTGWTTTTPEGFNWHYRYWEEEPKTGYTLIRGKTMDNTYLPQEFIDTLLENYDERLIRAYLHGEYVNLQYGSTYYAFDRKINVVDGIKYDASLPLFVGMDFNVDPMCAVVWQKYIDGVNVIDEFVLRHAGGQDLITQRMCDEINNEYHSPNMVCYPDPTGKKRGTAQKLSDFDIIRANGFRVKAKRSSPSITDSVNAVNNAMKFIQIDPKCKTLIKDLEQVVNKDGTREIDKSDPHLTHMSDAFRYGIDLEFPISKPKMRQL